MAQGSHYCSSQNLLLHQDVGEGKDNGDHNADGWMEGSARNQPLPRSDGSTHAVAQSFVAATIGAAAATNGARSWIGRKAPGNF